MPDHVDDHIPSVAEALATAARLLREAEMTTDLAARASLRDIADTWVGLAAEVAEARI